MAIPVDSTQRAIVAKLVARRLRVDGLRPLLADAPIDTTVGATRLSQNLFTYILISLIIYGGRVTPLGAFSTALGLGSLLVFMASLIASKNAKPITAYLLVVVLWLVATIHLAVTGQWGTLFVVLAFPLALVVGLIVAVRALVWVARVPFVVPVGFIIVLAPLLTEDPWRLAMAAGSGLLLFAPIVCGPLAFVVGVSIWRSDPFLTLSTAELSFDRLRKPEEVAARLLKKVATGNEKSELMGADIGGALKPAYTEEFRRSNLYYLSEAFKKGFRRRALGRLLYLLAGSGLASFILIYVIAWAAMPYELAAEWAKTDSIGFYRVPFFGFTAELPLGPYLAVPSLFTIVAIAGLLAFSATEERYSTEIRSAVIQDRAERLLLIGLPYIYFSDRTAFPQPGRDAGC